MKFRINKMKYIIKKGLALVLSAVIVTGMIPPVPAAAAPVASSAESGVYIGITNATTETYLNYMYSNSLNSNQFEKAKDRVVIMGNFLNGLNNNISKINPDDKNSHEKNTVKWHPSQKDIDNGRNLYLLEWVNGNYANNPGDGYEILGRIVYLGSDNKIYYSKQVNIDEYARKMHDPGYSEQWDQGRINQALFAMPEDCRQVLGIVMCNESGGGNNNNTWWMDSCIVHRIESDNLSDVSVSFTNERGFTEYCHANSYIVGYVSDHDIKERYLGGMDMDQEWLYLLETPAYKLASDDRYYAQIVTADRTDLSGEELTITIDYTDISGEKKSYTQTISDADAENAYPELISSAGFSDDDDKFYSSSVRQFSNILPAWQWVDYSLIWGDIYNQSTTTAPSKDVPNIEKANDFALEIMNVPGAPKSEYAMYHLNKLANFSWEDAYFTEMNLTAMAYFGNFVNYTKLTDGYLSGYAATDVKLNLPTHEYMASVDSISIYNKTNKSVQIQDIRIYAANHNETARTKMNGGISTQRIMADASDSECLASLDIVTGADGNPLSLNVGGSLVTCTPESTNDVVSRKLLVNTGKKMDFYKADDSIGVLLSVADVYKAGIEAFTADYDHGFEHPEAGWYLNNDRIFSTKDIKNFMYAQLVEHRYVSSFTAKQLELLMEAYFRENLTLNIQYLDSFGALRRVQVPFVTAYMMQLLSDNDGKLGQGTKEYVTTATYITSVLQQGQDVSLRIPISQYSKLLSIELTFGESPDGISNFRNNEYYYTDDPRIDYGVVLYAGGSLRNEDGTKESWHDELADEDDDDWLVNQKIAESYLQDYETFIDGAVLPNNDSLSLRYIRVYEHVNKDNFKSVYNQMKRIAEFKTSLPSDYYYASSNKNGHLFGNGHTLSLSVTEGTLISGTVDLSDKDLENTYLVEIRGQMISTTNQPPEEINVTLAYTTTGGEQIKMEDRKLSELAQDFNGYVSMNGLDPLPANDEHQVREDLREGTVRFILDLESVSSFDYISLTLPDGTTNSWQVNSIYLYNVTELSQRYSSPEHYSTIPLFTRDFDGDIVALNNKPAALQAGKTGKTFTFSKVNSDGTFEAPDADLSYQDEYITVPPTSITYEESLKNLGLAVTKYSYTVDVDVANVLDAGSGNYFYFQLVFENGTSGVVLANQQLAADSFRQGYTESFTIHTTQNYGNVTSVRVICDTSSGDSTAFDKLNIDKITVSLPSNGGAKSWIMDKVGWIDINFKDDGAEASISTSKESTGFPNSMVVKEFARTRTASTARLLFNISTSAASPAYSESADSLYEAALTYVDSAGYTQTYNFNLKNAIFNYIENNSWTYLFRPNMSDYFTLSLNDIVSVKSLSIYRADGQNDWIIKDISISQFSELGDVYMDTTGEFKRYVENETLVTTSTNSEQTITHNGNATFVFNEHSINVNTSGTNPEGWTTTITRLPSTTQETLNVYMYAGSSGARTFEFDAANPVPVKGRIEYTFKDNGATIGSESFAFTETAVINGVTVLKASGIKVSGMNQLKSLYLSSESTDNPIVSGVQVERIRGNTIVERLYFDFHDETLTQGNTYSATAKADTSASNTKQTLALQVSNGQKQTFGTNNDVAVALLYTNENDASSKQKTVYSSPYIFFTDVGITSLSNTSVLEIPFAVTGVDQIVGFSIVSSGVDVSFENALIYNYLSSPSGDVLIDSCPIAEKIVTSTVAKQYMEKVNTSVTPVTLTFTTSDDSQYPGAGSSGRLPLTLTYKNNAGKDISITYDNLLNLLPAGAVPTAGGTVSFDVQLANLESLTSASITAMDDDWHLYKITAAINQIVNATQIPYNTEAFVDSWVKSNSPVTATFGSNTPSKIIIFSVTGLAVESGNVETATSGNVLKIKALPGEKVSFMPTITAEGTPDRTVVWDTSQYGDYMVDGSGTGIDFTVPLNYNGTSSEGQVFTFTGYCAFDTSKVITITIEVENIPETTPETTPEDVRVDVTMTPDTGSAVKFELLEGDSFRYKVESSATTTIWSFAAQTNIDGYSVEFTPATLTVDTSAAGVHTTTMVCRDAEGNTVFTSDIEIVVAAPVPVLTLNLKEEEDLYGEQTKTLSFSDNLSSLEFEIPAIGSYSYLFTASIDVAGYDIDIKNVLNESFGSDIWVFGNWDKNKVVNEITVNCTETATGNTRTINVTFKTLSDKTASTSTVSSVLMNGDASSSSNRVFKATDSTKPARYSITADDDYKLTFSPIASSYSDVTVEILANNSGATLSGNTISFNSTAAAVDTVLFTAKVTCLPASGAMGTATEHYVEVVKAAPGA